MTDARVPTAPYAVRRPPRAGLLLLDRNEGPPPPKDLWRAAAGAGEALHRYPDPAPLERRLAAALGVEPARVLVTAGADDAIDRCCRAFLDPARTCVYPVPTFEMLGRYVRLAGARRRTVSWAGGAFPVHAARAALDADVALLALVSPNNPTGSVVTAEELVALARAAGETMVLFDHAYAEYADRDLTAVAASLENVVTVRTLSKAWGLAGCRVGYAIGQPDVVTRLRAAGAPYPVSGPALALAARRLAMGGAAVRAHVAGVRTSRRRVTELLVRAGARVVPSEANFVLGDFGRRAAFVRDALLAAGVLVRDFTALPELGAALRIAVTGTEVDRRVLEPALAAALDPEALLFDLDGVLADVSQSYRQCIVATAASWGARVTVDDIARAKAGGGAADDWDLTRRLLAARGIVVAPDAIRHRFQRAYRGGGGRGGLRERERSLLDADGLRRLLAGRPGAVVTARPRDEAEWFLRRSGLDGAVAALVAREDAPAKPDASPVRLALERLGVRRAWLVGDTPDDARAAIGAGVVPLGIVAPGDDPGVMRRALEEAGVVRVLERLTDLAELLP